MEWVSTDIRSRVHLRVSHRPEEKKVPSRDHAPRHGQVKSHGRGGGGRKQISSGGNLGVAEARISGYAMTDAFFVSVGSRRGGEREVGRVGMVFVLTWVSCDGFVCVFVYDCKAHHRS